jgi:hypothetical protein
MQHTAELFQGIKDTRLFSLEEQLRSCREDPHASVSEQVELCFKMLYAYADIEFMLDDAVTQSCCYAAEILVTLDEPGLSDRIKNLIHTQGVRLHTRALELIAQKTPDADTSPV